MTLMVFFHASDGAALSAKVFSVSDPSVWNSISYISICLASRHFYEFPSRTVWHCDLTLDV